MAYLITDTCIGCGACVKICPSDAIQGEKKELHNIIAGICIECGACGRVCPKSSVEDAFGDVCEKISKKLWKKPVFDIEVCMSCGICIDTCPAGCLNLKKSDNKKDTHSYPFLLKPSLCIECGFCVSDCPVEAIKLELMQVAE